MKRSKIWLNFTVIGVVLLGWAAGLSGCNHGEVTYLPVPKDTPGVEEFPVCLNTAKQWQPAISGNIVVWVDYRSKPDTEAAIGNGDVYGYDLSTGTEFPICIDPADQSDPAISGNVVVWQDFRHGNWDVYGAILSR